MKDTDFIYSAYNLVKDWLMEDKRTGIFLLFIVHLGKYIK